jgi:hypothetical protein
VALLREQLKLVYFENPENLSHSVNKIHKHEPINGVLFIAVVGI